MLNSVHCTLTEGIYDTLSQCSLVSKAAGGIGLSVSNIRAKGSYIRGTKGTSNGLVPMLRVFDATARSVMNMPYPDHDRVCATVHCTVLYGTVL